MRKVFLNSEPYLLDIYPKVIMDEFVPHPGDILPGNVGGHPPRAVGQALGGLTDDSS